MTRIMSLAIIADISLLGALMYYFGLGKGILIMILMCLVGSISGSLAGSLVRRKR